MGVEGTNKTHTKISSVFGVSLFLVFLCYVTQFNAKITTKLLQLPNTFGKTGTYEKNSPTHKEF